jgi:hypothetical protein
MPPTGAMRRCWRFEALEFRSMADLTPMTPLACPFLCQTARRRGVDSSEAQPVTRTVVDNAVWSGASPTDISQITLHFSTPSIPANEERHTDLPLALGTYWMGHRRL